MGERLDWLFLIGKTLLVIVGGILFVAGLVDLVVIGPTLQGTGVLFLGLALAGPPIAFAFRDAVKEAKKGRL